MKKILLLLFAVFIAGKYCFGQQTPYILPLPEKWSSEKIIFPISFAPGIPFKGNEDLRFTPGWSDSTSNDYWSYTYVWFIEGTPKVNSDTLKNYITEYFNGLFRLNNKTQSAETATSFTKPKIKTIKTIINDQETYEGEISTLNFLTGKPLTLFARVHVRNYPGSNHSALLFELSPKPYDNTVWTALDNLVSGFQYKQ
jgi:hypothetical protein